MVRETGGPAIPDGMTPVADGAHIERVNEHIDYIELPGGDLTATKSFYSSAFGWGFTD